MNAQEIISAQPGEIFASDIPLDTARMAHYGTSMVPEKRGDEERRGYSAQLHADFRKLLHLAGTEREAEAVEDFKEYRRKYRSKTIAHLQAKGRCVSTMIAGPSNFNVRGAQKANRSADKRWEEASGYRDRFFRAMRKKYRNDGPVLSSDDDAVEQLKKKIEKAEATQALMKAANKVLRSKKKTDDEKVAALVESLGCKEETARKFLEPDDFGVVGFPSYRLTNNNANIRRMKERLEKIAAAKATPDTTEEGDDGVTFEDCPSANRVRLFFPGKPDAATRSQLKGNGFRWAPSIGCWQAYRNHHSTAFARRFAGLD
jgi:DNA repair exonuclease SbcCD ATPase subunit